MGPARRSISVLEIAHLDQILSDPCDLIANLAHSLSSGSTFAPERCGRSREIKVVTQRNKHLHIAVDSISKDALQRQSVLTFADAKKVANAHRRLAPRPGLAHSSRQTAIPRQCIPIRTLHSRSHSNRATQSLAVRSCVCAPANTCRLPRGHGGIQSC